MSGVELKACCIDLYAKSGSNSCSATAFPPGGLQLTEHLGELMGLGPVSTVLDVACGRGASALHLARCFGCAVVGVDLGPANLDARVECDPGDGRGGDRADVAEGAQ